MKPLSNKNLEVFVVARPHRDCSIPWMPRTTEKQHHQVLTTLSSSLDVLKSGSSSWKRELHAINREGAYWTAEPNRCCEIVELLKEMQPVG
jgi:hypothetical protein